MGYSFRLAARDLLYASSHRQDNTYHGLCYTSRGALAGTRNSSYHGPTSRKRQIKKERERERKRDSRTQRETQRQTWRYRERDKTKGN